MKTVIITGATGGLGSCITKYLVYDNTTHVICTYRNQNKFDSVLCDSKEKISRYKIENGEKYKEIEKLINSKTDEIIVILNAFSIDPIKAIGSYEASDIEDMLECNIRQPIYLINVLTKYCNTNGIALRVINIDSGAADFPLMGWGNYCSSKSYINAFLSVLLLENPEFKIVSVDPGVMDTQMQAKIRGTSDKVFNKVAEFQQYKVNGMLRNPKNVAEYIVNRYVLSWNAVELREKVK